MAFDIHQFDHLESLEGIDEALINEYQQTLYDHFILSPESHKLLDEIPQAGFWTFHFMEYGSDYWKMTVSQMSIPTVTDIIEEIFPRKITIKSPEDANQVIPELTAFWQFLKREYQLTQADQILEYLAKISPRYYEIMNDSSRFGMAKTMTLLARSEGFDLTNPEDILHFQKHYKENILPALDGVADKAFEESGMPTNTSKSRNKKKKMRKLARASRKKNRKR